MAMKSPPTTAARLLQTAALRVTPVRLGVLDVLARARAPLDVPAILAALPPHNRRRHGLSHAEHVSAEKDDPPRAWRGAGRGVTPSASRPMARRTSNPHFVCDACGRVECLSTAEVPPTLSKTMKVDRGYASRTPR